MRLRVAVLAVVQLALVAGAVAPQLLSRATGEDYLLRVEPVDPIDPFRGAYVTLSYPDLRMRTGEGAGRGDLFVSLVEEDGVWVMAGRSRTRPESGPYLACDDTWWEVRCGIDSYFVPQDEAAALQEGLADGGIATVRIDSRGVASVMSVDPD